MDTDPKLDALRKEWEEGLECLCFLTKTFEKSLYITHFAVITEGSGRYRLYRYFPLGAFTPNGWDQWAVSVDVDWTTDIGKVLKKLEDGFKMK